MQNILKHVSDQLSYLTGKCRRKFSVFGLWWCYWWRICLFTFSKNWSDLVWYVGLRPNFSITSRFAYYLGLRRNFWCQTKVWDCSQQKIKCAYCVFGLSVYTYTCVCTYLCASTGSIDQLTVDFSWISFQVGIFDIKKMFRIFMQTFLSMYLVLWAVLFLCL